MMCAITGGGQSITQRSREEAAPRREGCSSDDSMDLMLVALEGQANCSFHHRGQLTKHGLEHVRKASTLEQTSSGAYLRLAFNSSFTAPGPPVAPGMLGDNIQLVFLAYVLEIHPL